MEIAEFSKKLDIRALYEYAREVMFSTNSFLAKLEYSQMKTKYSDAEERI